MQDMMITVCTPTYNRAYCLNELFQSLKEQSCKSFEWLIVDDGSTDNTEELVHGWIAEGAEFPIRYIRKFNGGKHTAVNTGVENAQGELFFIVDSDDFLTPNAIQTISEKISELPRSGFGGIAFNKAYRNGELIGTTFSGDHVDATALERSKYHIMGDKAEVYFTHVLRQYPFPVFEGERFLTEAVVWNRIADDGYKLRWHNESIYLCEYREDGLSMNASGFNNFRGYTLFIRELLSYKQLAFKEKVRWLGVYASVGTQKGITAKQMAKLVEAPVPLIVFSDFLYFLKRCFCHSNRADQFRVKR